MAYAKSYSLILLGLLLLVTTSPGMAAEKIMDSSKFPPIAGEISGQLFPGVKSVLVNGHIVPISANQSFRTMVNLKAGQKYLVLILNYEGLKITKKYLILRKAKVKTFKVFVPKEETQKPVEIEQPAKLVRIEEKPFPVKSKYIAPSKRKNRKLLKTIKIAKPKNPALKVWEYLYVWEFDRGKLLLTKKKQGKFAAEVYIPEKRQWYDLKDLSRDELDAIIEENLPGYKTP